MDMTTTQTTQTKTDRAMTERNAKRTRLNDRAERIALRLTAARRRQDAAAIELCEVALRHVAEALGAA